MVLHVHVNAYAQSKIYKVDSLRLLYTPLLTSAQHYQLAATSEHNIWTLHAVCFSYDSSKDKWCVKSPSKQMGQPACLFMVCVQGASQQKAPPNICVHNCWSIARCDWRILKSVLQRPACSGECQSRKRSKTLYRYTPVQYFTSLWLPRYWPVMSDSYQTLSATT